jgi:hypothetical protein
MGPGRLNVVGDRSPSLSPSSFWGSTTGNVIVSKKTLGAATMPNNFSHIFFSLQLVNVGNNVDRRT